MLARERDDQVGLDAAKVPPLAYLINGFDRQGGVLCHMKFRDV